MSRYMSRKPKRFAKAKPAATERLLDPWTSSVDGRGELPHSNFVTVRINHLASMLNRSPERPFFKLDVISVGEWRALTNLLEIAPCSAQELAEHMFVDKSRISRLIRKLAERDYIVVRPNSENGSRRSAAISVTPKGRQVHRTLLPYAERRQKSLLECLTLEERRVLWVALDKRFDAAQSISRKRLPKRRTERSPNPCNPVCGGTSSVPTGCCSRG